MQPDIYFQAGGILKTSAKSGRIITKVTKTWEPFTTEGIGTPYGIGTEVPYMIRSGTLLSGGKTGLISMGISDIAGVSEYGISSVSAITSAGKAGAIPFKMASLGTSFMKNYYKIDTEPIGFTIKAAPRSGALLPAFGAPIVTAIKTTSPLSLESMIGGKFAESVASRLAMKQIYAGGLPVLAQTRRTARITIPSAAMRYSEMPAGPTSKSMLVLGTAMSTRQGSKLRQSELLSETLVTSGQSDFISFRPFNPKPPKTPAIGGWMTAPTNEFIPRNMFKPIKMHGMKKGYAPSFIASNLGLTARKAPLGGKGPFSFEIRPVVSNGGDWTTGLFNFGGKRSKRSIFL